MKTTSAWTEYRKKTNPYELTVCPWDAIDMVDTTLAAQAVALKGGPPEYVERHWDDLVEAAHRNAEKSIAKK